MSIGLNKPDERILGERLQISHDEVRHQRGRERTEVEARYTVVLEFGPLGVRRIYDRCGRHLTFPSGFRGSSLPSLFCGSCLLHPSCLVGKGGLNLLMERLSLRCPENVFKCYENRTYPATGRTDRDICMSSIRTLFSRLRMTEAGCPSSFTGVQFINVCTTSSEREGRFFAKFATLLRRADSMSGLLDMVTAMRDNDIEGQ